jgi:hypothetical protein
MSRQGRIRKQGEHQIEAASSIGCDAPQGYAMRGTDRQENLSTGQEAIRFRRR